MAEDGQIQAWWEYFALPVGISCIAGGVSGRGWSVGPFGLEKQQMAKLPKQRLNHLGGLISASELVFELKQLLPAVGLLATSQHTANVGLEQKPGAWCRQRGCCGRTELNSSSKST